MGYFFIIFSNIVFPYETHLLLSDDFSIKYFIKNKNQVAVL